jgi:hypothetical protein
MDRAPSGTADAGDGAAAGAGVAAAAAGAGTEGRNPGRGEAPNTVTRDPRRAWRNLRWRSAFDMGGGRESMMPVHRSIAASTPTI